MDDLEPQYEYSDTGFPVPRPIQYFSLAFRSPNVLRLVNVDQHIASCVQEKVFCLPSFFPPWCHLLGRRLLRCGDSVCLMLWSPTPDNQPTNSHLPPENGTIFYNSTVKGFFGVEKHIFTQSFHLPARSPSTCNTYNGSLLTFTST